MDINNVEILGVQNSSAEQSQVRQSKLWTLLIDGSSTRDGLGVGVLLKSLEGTIIRQAIRLSFATSNNEAEYEALIMGLKKAKTLSV